MTLDLFIKDVRQTSIDCYRQIKREGLLSRRRMEVYEMLFHHGPATATELLKRLKDAGGGTVYSDSQIRARLFELREMGVIWEQSIRRCSVTHRSVIEWKTRPGLPQPLKKKPSAYERGWKDGYDKAISEYSTTPM